uniref:Uncharacterized protein n=1 Tax=Sphaerodactylus townsendi TaxID=933632 RepID=A0ACB8FY45_9SAUR
MCFPAAISCLETLIASDCTILIFARASSASKRRLSFSAKVERNPYLCLACKTLNQLFTFQMDFNAEGLIAMVEGADEEDGVDDANLCGTTLDRAVVGTDCTDDGLHSILDPGQGDTVI